jgi:hypothetical protein
MDKQIDVDVFSVHLCRLALARGGGPDCTDVWAPYLGSCLVPFSSREAALKQRILLIFRTEA